MAKSVKPVSFAGILKMVTATVAVVVFASVMSITSSAAAPEYLVQGYNVSYTIVLDDGQEGLYSNARGTTKVDDDFVSRILFYSTNGGKAPMPTNEEGKEVKEGSFTANKFTKYSEFKTVLTKLIDSGGQLSLIVANAPIVDNDKATLTYISFPKIAARPKAPTIAANYVFDDTADSGRVADLLPAKLFRDGREPAYYRNFYSSQPLFFAVPKGKEGAVPRAVGKTPPATDVDITPKNLQFKEIVGDAKSPASATTYQDLTPSNNGFPINASDVAKEEKKSFVFRERASTDVDYTAVPPVLAHAAGKEVTLSPTLAKAPSVKIDYKKSEGFAISGLKDSIMYTGGTPTQVEPSGTGDTYAAFNTFFDVEQSSLKTAISFADLLSTNVDRKTDIGIFKKATSKGPRSELQIIRLLPRLYTPLEVFSPNNIENKNPAPVFDEKTVGATPNLEFAGLNAGEVPDSATKWTKTLPKAPDYKVAARSFAVRFVSDNDHAASLPSYFTINNKKADKGYVWDWEPGITLRKNPLP